MTSLQGVRLVPQLHLGEFIPEEFKDFDDEGDAHMESTKASSLDPKPIPEEEKSKTDPNSIHSCFWVQSTAFGSFALNIDFHVYVRNVLKIKYGDGTGRTMPLVYKDDHRQFLSLSLSLPHVYGMHIKYRGGVRVSPGPRHLSRNARWKATKEDNPSYASEFHKGFELCIESYG